MVLKTSSYSAHYWCCRGSGEQGSREPLAVAGDLVGLGVAARRATDEVEEPEGWRGAARDNEPAPGTEQAGSGEESQDAAAGAAGADAGGGQLPALGDAAGDGLAVASLAPSGGDACSQKRA